MKIGRRLNITFLGIFLLFILFFSFGFILLNKFHNEFDKISNQTLPVIRMLDGIKLASSGIEASANEFVFMNSLSKLVSKEETILLNKHVAEELNNFDSAQDEYAKYFSEYKRLVLKYFSKENELMASIENNGQKLINTGIELVNLAKQNSPLEKLIDKSDQLENIEGHFLNAFDEAVLNENKEIVERETRAFKVIDISIRVLLIFTVIAFIVVFIFAKVVSNSVSAPLERLRKAMHEVGSGKMNVRARVEANDEIGSLASSFNKMIGDLEDARRDTIIINNELMKANRDLLANEDTLRLNNQTLAESEEELRAANQELLANEESLRRMTEELEQKVKQRTRDLEKERHALEIKVQERTKELEIKLKTLAEMNEKMTGRELRMIELKKQINGLMKELGRAIPFDI